MGESKDHGPWIKERYRKKLGMELPDGTRVSNDAVTPTESATVRKHGELPEKKKKKKCVKKDHNSACATKLLLCQSEAFAQAIQLECPVTCAVGGCGTKRPSSTSLCNGASRSTHGLTKLFSTTDTSITRELEADQGVLLSQTAWTPTVSEGAILETHTPSEEHVMGVSVQGEPNSDATTSKAASRQPGWVKTFKLKYWDKKLQVWMDVVGKQGGPLIFPGNTDTASVVHTNFYSPVKTAKLRIIPLEFHNRVSMRVALQVCDPRKPPPPVQEPPKKTTPNKAVEDKVSKKKKQQADRVDWIGTAINKTTGLHMSPEDIERVVKSTPTGQEH